MIISIVLHGSAIGLLFFFMAPAETKPAREQQPTVSERRVQQVHEQLHQITLQQMREKLETLEQIEEELEKIERQRRAEYALATQDLRTNALEAARKGMEAALEQQAMAGARLGKASSAAPRLAEEFDRMLRDAPMPVMP